MLLWSFRNHTFLDNDFVIIYLLDKMISSSFFHTKDCEFNKITFSFLAKVSIIFLFQLFPRTYTIPIYIPKTKPNELEMVHCTNNTIGLHWYTHNTWRHRRQNYLSNTLVTAIDPNFLSSRSGNSTKIPSRSW